MANEDYHREAYARSLDTICVQNITMEDFILWDDKFGPRQQRVMVPALDKDIGKGKGKQHLPRYLAERYTNQIIVQLINDRSAEEWEKVKGQYRTDEQRKYEEKMALRTNDQGLWKEYLPQIWLGFVERYGGTTLPEPKQDKVIADRNPLDRLSKEMDLENMMYQEKESDQS